MMKRNAKLMAMMFVALGLVALLSLAQGCSQADTPSDDGNTDGGASAFNLLAAQPVSAKELTTTDQPTWPATQQRGTNQRYFAVKNKLDEGGDFYLYWNVKDALRNIVNDFKGMTQGSPNMPAQVPMVVATVDLALDTLGLYDVEDIGVSVKKDQTMSISKTFISIPGEKKGVFSLLGGAPHKFESIKYAPADTALFGSVDFDLAQTLQLIRDCVQGIGGVEAMAEFNNGLAMASAQSGVNLEAVIQSLGGEYLFIVNFHPTQMITPPEPELNGLSIRAPQAAVGIRVKNSLLYDQLTTMLMNSGAPVEIKSTDTLKVMAINLPPNGVYEVDPRIAFDGEYVFFATHSSYLDAIMATKAGGKNLSDQDEFKKMMQGMPSEGNELGFLSAAGGVELRKIIDQLQNIPEFQRDISAQINLMFNKAMMATEGSAAVRVNDSAGIYFINKTKSGSPGAGLMAVLAPALGLATDTTTKLDNN